MVFPPFAVRAEALQIFSPPSRTLPFRQIHRAGADLEVAMVEFSRALEWG
jgi:hypothetical protein